MNQGMRVNSNKANYMERVPNTSPMAIEAQNQKTLRIWKI
jgi:hypothetical protein